MIPPSKTLRHFRGSPLTVSPNTAYTLRADALARRDIAQYLNYLRIIGLKLCLLINFNKPRVEIRRIVNGIGKE